jgi:hypothetical protein
MTESIMSKIGRPTTYHKDYPKKAYKLLCEGKTLTQVARALGTSLSQISRWRADPRRAGFKQAIEAGLQASEAYWTEIGARGIMGEIKGFNYGAWQFFMRAAFKWNDVTKIASTTEEISTLSDKDLERKIAQLSDSTNVVNFKK